MIGGRRLLLLVLVLPSLVVAGWWWWNLPEPQRTSPSWVVHEQVFEALLDGELLRTTEVLDAGTLRGQAHTIEADPRDFSAAEGMLSNPAGSPAYAWCVGRRSGFRLDVLEPADRRLHIELANGTSVPQHVSVSFNGQPLIEQDLPVGGPATTIVAEVPAALQVRGPNRVELGFAQVGTRQLIGQPVPLPIAAVLTHTHFLRTDRVERIPGPPPPLGLRTETGADGSRAVLVLPPGTSARAPLRLPPAERVALRFSIERLGSPFELWLWRDAGQPVRLLRIEAADFAERELQVDLSAWAGEPVVLDFWAHDGSGDSARIAAAVVLVPEGERTAPPESSTPATPSTPPASPATASRPSFLLVTLDAFARRQLGVVGAAADVVPRLAELGARGTVFADATAPASYTLASVASLLTGLTPQRHGVALALEPTADGAAPGRLRDSAPRLAQLLAQGGWRTAAFVTNPNAAARHGYDAGFERFDELFRDPSLWDEGVSGEQLPPRLAEWLAEVDGQPFFGWVHVFQPHAPYVAPPDLVARWVSPYEGPVRGDRAWIDSVRYGEVPVADEGWRHLRELYAARLALADRTLGELLDTLSAAGRAEDTVVIVTSDHGEALGEHGDVEHGDSVYGEQIEVPLVLCVPGRTPAKVAGPVTLVDIAPTVLALAGVPRPAGLDGVDLLAGPPDLHRGLVARSADRLPRLSWTSADMRLIVDLATRRRELYDLARDPLERENLYERRPATAALLFRELSAAVCAAEAEREAEESAAQASKRGAQAGAANGGTANDGAAGGDPQDEVLSEQMRQIGYVTPAAGAQPVADDPARRQGELLRSLLRRT